MSVVIATLTGFCGVIAALLGIYLKVSKIVQVRSEQRDKRKRIEMQERKEEIHDEITIPVDKLKDKVVDLATDVHEFTKRETEDHQDIVNIMNKSSRSHKQILSMVSKLNKDHEKIHKHDQIIENHTHTLDQHTNDIAFLKRTKADKIKQKRGNKK